MSGMFKLDAENVKGAVVSLVVAALVAIGFYVLQVGDVFKLDWHVLVNAAAIAFVTSLLKSLGTTSEGKFVGAVQVK